MLLAMVSLPRTLTLAAITLGAGSAMAQVSKGGTPPEFAFEKVWNDGPQTFADFAGKVVILDFAQTW